MVYVNEKPLIRPTLGISAAITYRYLDLSVFLLLIYVFEIKHYFPISILVATNTIDNSIFLHSTNITHYSRSVYTYGTGQLIISLMAIPNLSCLPVADTP